MENPKKKSKIKLLLGVLFIIVVIGAIASQGEKDTPKLVDNNVIEDKTEFNVGETVELNNVYATLVSVTKSQGGDFNTPADGNEFVLCEFMIENNTEKDLAISSMLSFDAYCDDLSISQSISGLIAANGKQQLDGTIAAGKKMNGVIAYELSKDWKQLEINFTPDVWSSKDITFIANN